MPSDRLTPEQVAAICYRLEDRLEFRAAALIRQQQAELAELREAQTEEAIYAYSAEHHLDTNCAACMRMAQQAILARHNEGKG